MELRLALVADGKGVTYVSDLLTEVPPQLIPVEGLPYGQIDRPGRRLQPEASADVAGGDPISGAVS